MIAAHQPLLAGAVIKSAPEQQQCKDAHGTGRRNMILVAQCFSAR